MLVEAVEKNSRVHIGIDSGKGTVGLALDSSLSTPPFLGLSFTPRNARMIAKALVEFAKKAENRQQTQTNWPAIFANFLKRKKE